MCDGSLSKRGKLEEHQVATSSSAGKAKTNRSTSEVLCSKKENIVFGFGRLLGITGMRFNRPEVGHSCQRELGHRERRVMKDTREDTRYGGNGRRDNGGRPRNEYSQGRSKKSPQFTHVFKSFSRFLHIGLG